MAIVLKKTSVMIVGFGWVGTIMAKELTEAGFNVVALEYGPMRDTWPDGIYPQVIDELTYNIRRKLFQDLSKSIIIIQHNTSQQATPYRQLAIFLSGTDMDGVGPYWSGVHLRVDSIELRVSSHYEECYGKNSIPWDMIIQGFGVTYGELEPLFDKAEKVFGISGTVWSIKSKVVGEGRDGNVFALDHSDDFPLSAQKSTWPTQLFERVALGVGYYPYSLPSANTPDSHTSPCGTQIGPYDFCGFCSGYACCMYSKASPNVNVLPALRQEKRFELRANANVLRANLADDKPCTTGVIYTDSQRREVEQPADLVTIGAFQFHNIYLMLLSGIGKLCNPETGEEVVECNFAHQNMTTIKAISDKNTYTNPPIDTGGNGVGVDDLNADNFNHGTAGFVGGSLFWASQAGTRSISGFPVPPGISAWGSKRKTMVTDTYTRHLSMDVHNAHQFYWQNYPNLDSNYKNVSGQPLPRMTFDQQKSDIKMAQFMFNKMTPTAKATKPKYILGSPKSTNSHFGTTTYQTTHMNDGAVMGKNPKTSATNRYLQGWSVHNVFVVGTSMFPQGLGYSPTSMVAALAYRSAKAVREQHPENPGSLVQV